MTGFGLHDAAIAGVGRAKVEDPRVVIHEGRLIGDIERELKKHMPRATASDVVQAVTEHYRKSTDVVTGEAVCAELRALRVAEFRAEQKTRAQLTPAEQAQMTRDWDAIQAWPCDEPGCPGATPGVKCINPITGLPYEKYPGHLSRIRKAYYQPTGTD